jgi:hypothetical protein
MLSDEREPGDVGARSRHPQTQFDTEIPRASQKQCIDYSEHEPMKASFRSTPKTPFCNALSLSRSREADISRIARQTAQGKHMVLRNGVACRNNREAISEDTVLHAGVGMAYATGEDFDEDL